MAALLLLATPVCAAGPADFLPVADRPVLRSDTIKEASGLAVSSRDDGFLWIINDSGAAPEIHLVEAGGKDRGKVTLAAARNVDWEDLVSFSLDGIPYLLVADTGDNNSKRDACTLYVLREPALPEAGKNLKGTVPIEWKIDFRFSAGPRDCEAVAVDTSNRKILLLSKRTHPPELHELPLHPENLEKVQEARKTGQTAVAAPTDSVIPFRDQPTGLALSPDHSLAAVVTYYGVFLFPRKPGESWARAFAAKPAVLPPHCLAQAESIAFTKDGNSILVVSEGRSSPIVRYQRALRQPQN